MTRADKIRQMDDQQLADMLCSLREETCMECYFTKQDQALPRKCGALIFLQEEVDGPDETDRR